MREEEFVEQAKVLMHKKDHIRNIGTIAHIDHGKTTLSDSLVAGAGLISEDLAGKKLFMDFDKQEQERGITIYSANATMVHPYGNDHYLINLIDTPGHVDFGGDVTRAMRAVDGAIVLVDAVEGVMPQTETVLRQALRERVKPVLYINKVDRLINELKLTPDEMQKRLIKIIEGANVLIRKYAEPDYQKWAVKVDEGSVAFGSALRKWAISFPYMKQHGITFKEIIDRCSNNEHEELRKKAPLYKVILDMVIKHLPPPYIAQQYRVGKIWQGDANSEVGKSMNLCDENGKLACVITKIVDDPYAGSVATARVFSGTLKGGQEVYLVGQHRSERVQQVCIYAGPKRISIDEVKAGNVVGIIGIPSAFSGETLCDPSEVIQPFEAIKHIFEPVVTKSIEAKSPKDLQKVVETLKKVSREDPTLLVQINQETGEHLVSGLGELHLDAKVERKLKDMGVEIIASPPIVVYRETVKKAGVAVEGKSPNKHNRFYLTVEPMPQAIYDAMVAGDIKDMKVKKKDAELADKLRKLGMDPDDAKSVLFVMNRCMLLDSAKGIQYLNEAMELIKEAVQDVIKEGPLTREPCVGILIRVVDANLHEDAVHRGPSQVIPAVRFGLKNTMLKAGVSLLEPKQTIRIDSPQEDMGSVMKEIQNRRGEIISVDNELGAMIMKVKLPVSEMFGFEAALKSATGGKGFYFLIDVTFENMPNELLERVAKGIRKRKGLDEALPRPEEGQ